ncbi:MAG: hypothetical protein KDD37_01280 [Bdellovibrionales bacterium]|nr:hypothetical protein [Bdellovibrionales bacterium]
MKKLLGFICIGIFAVSCAQSSKKASTEKAAMDGKAAATATAAKASAGATECKSGTDVRSIDVKSADGAFEVIYTKFGEAKSIATGGREHCEAIRDRVKGNLANAGFTCN